MDKGTEYIVPQGNIPERPIPGEQIDKAHAIFWQM